MLLSQAIGQNRMIIWLHPTTGGQGSSFFFVSRKGEWDTGRSTSDNFLTMTTCQWFQRNWQMFRVEFLVFAFVHFSFSIPLDWNVCVQVCISFLCDLTEGKSSNLFYLFLHYHTLFPHTVLWSIETTVFLFQWVDIEEMKSFNQKWLN